MSSYGQKFWKCHKCQAEAHKLRALIIEQDPETDIQHLSEKYGTC